MKSKQKLIILLMIKILFLPTEFGDYAKEPKNVNLKCECQGRCW